jgi:formylglycine-generating enzyme required for sulfatase activity
MGSWLAVVAADGRAPGRVPLAVVRLETTDLEVTLFEREEIPPGCLPVQGGALTLGGDRGNPLSPPARAATVSDFFYAVHPVSCGEYAAFLGAIGDDASRRAPRFRDEGGNYWPGPPWEVPTAERIAAWPRERAERVERLQRTPFDWEEDWPVVAVSWRDALAWCAWRRARDGRPWTLATSAAWERAVRGADQRVFSMGDSLDSRWANGLFSFPKGHPAGRDTFPHDESPFGMRHLTGNARTLCLNRDAPPGLDWRAGRGGDWAESELYARCSFYAVQDVVQVAITTGFRPAVPIRLGNPVHLA